MGRATALIVCAALLTGGCAGLAPEGEVYRVEAPVPSNNGKAAVGAPYVDFEAAAMDGSTFRLRDLVGQKVVLLQFWGIRCAPCLAEIPFLSRLQERYGPAGLQVVGVNTDRVAAEQLRKALDSRKLTPTYPVVLDPEFAVAKSYTHLLIPVSVLIDLRGSVTAIHTGYKPELDSVIEAEVEGLLPR